MLEDKIIVQDRGFDAGLAALMQNANKGNMDPAALMAMMNNNGMGGNGCGGFGSSYCSLYGAVGVETALETDAVKLHNWLLN